MVAPMSFVTNDIRTPLTAQEVNYWKLNLSRIMKIGTEFEFNLPDKPTGTCRGLSFACPCKWYESDTTDCWKKCLNENNCKATPNAYRCVNFNKDKCSQELCNDCKTYKFRCIGVLCSNFTPICVTCKKFEIDCDSCEYRFDPLKNPDEIRRACLKTLSPSGTYGITSKSGVHAITTDGSLLGKKGMEVITTGRRVDYWEFFKMAKNIIDTAVERGAYVNERCSIHMHGLASYYGQVATPVATRGKVSELEKPIPEIILANLHQLFRRYQNAITWMTTGLNDPKHLTRWEKFRVSILKVSAITQNMQSVRDAVVSNSGNNKYGWVNYKFCKFDLNGNLQRLHVEVRVADMLLSPSAVAALACLYYSLFIKAVELSRYGLINVGDKTWWDQALLIKSALLNNCSDWQEGTKNGRFSNTANLHKYIDILVADSFELISQVKHILAPIGPAYEVLEKLAESPCSIRRCDNTSWKEIENELAVTLTNEGKFIYEINKIIDTRLIVGIPDKQTWLQHVVTTLKANTQLNNTQDDATDIQRKVSLYIEDGQANGELIWADKIGSMIII